MSAVTTSAEPQVRRQDGVGADVEALARVMDDAVTIPGLRLRLGLDALLGLIPGVGDAGAALASLYILAAAHRRGAPQATITRMALNVAVDAVVGVVPVLGDLFDLFFKANRRNVELLRRSIAASPDDRRRFASRDRWYVILLLAGLTALVVGCLVVAYILLAWLLGWVMSF